MCWAVNNGRGSKDQSKYATCLQVESSASTLFRARIISNWLVVVRFRMSYIDFTRRKSLMKNPKLSPSLKLFGHCFITQNVRFHNLLEFRLLN